MTKVVKCRDVGIDWDFEAPPSTQAGIMDRRAFPRKLPLP